MTAPDDLEARLVAVAARYAEPHRRYHNVDHLISILDHVDRLLADVPVSDPEEVRLAALFHDAVYDPRSTTNEADSAELAAEVLSGVIPDAAIEQVVRLILATAGHEPTAVDEAILVDADLAILGGEPMAYAAYTSGVREEYGHVDAAGWRAGRARVLQTFLDRERIFATAPMARLEAAARRNIETEIAALAC